MHPYTFLAMDLARERSEWADRHRLAAIARGDTADRPSLPRQALAHSFALISRSSAWATRRLDECVADDLGRRLSPTD